jgi:hypothetical protein
VPGNALWALHDNETSSLDDRTERNELHPVLKAGNLKSQAKRKLVVNKVRLSFARDRE